MAQACWRPCRFEGLDLLRPIVLALVLLALQPQVGLLVSLVRFDGGLGRPGQSDRSL